MSDSSEVSMYVVLSSYEAPGKKYDGYRNPDQAPDLANYLASSTLVSDNLPNYIRILRKMNFSTRGDYFQTRMHRLTVVSGIENLDFFSAAKSLDKYVETNRCKGDGEVFEYKCAHLYRLISGKEQLNAIVASLDRLIDWCLAHPEETCDITGYEDADEIIHTIRGAYCTLTPNSDGPGDEGQGPGFLFCALKTAGDLLRYAKWWDLMVVYDNVSMVYET